MQFCWERKEKKFCQSGIRKAMLDFKSRLKVTTLLQNPYGNIYGKSGDFPGPRYTIVVSV
jgi:hypothetical protein